MKSVFPRDENGNLKTKKPCQTPGCSWPNWHVCLIGKPDTFPQILRREAARMRKYSYSFTEAHRQSISDSQQARWERVRLENFKRDETIVKLYIDGASIGDIRKRYDLGYRAVSNILRRAEKKGLVMVRKQGEPARKIVVNQ